MSLVRCGRRSRAMVPISNRPTGMRPLPPSIRVYMPALACNSSALSSALIVQMLRHDFGAALQHFLLGRAAGEDQGDVAVKGRQARALALHGLGALALGDVAGDREQRVDAPLRVAQRRRVGFQPAPGSLEPLDLELERAAAAG